MSDKQTLAAISESDAAIMAELKRQDKEIMFLLRADLTRAKRTRRTRGPGLGY